MDVKKLCDPEAKTLVGVIDCQIYEGKASGFGRWIYGEFEHNYIGYFERGMTVGNALKFKGCGKVIRSGVYDYNCHNIHTYKKNIVLYPNVS